MDGRRQLARAIDQHTDGAARSLGQRREYATVRGIAPLQIEMHGSGLLLDEDDLVISQWVRRYDYDIEIEVGDTVVVDHLPNDDFLVADVVTDTEAYPLNGYVSLVGTGSQVVFGVRHPGETQDHFRVLADGTVQFGSGTAPPDTTLYRPSPGVLKTDGTFEAGALNIDSFTIDSVQSQDVWVDPNDSGGKLYFGSAKDTRLYRSSAGIIKTDGGMNIAGAVRMDAVAGGNKLFFGSSTDVTLARASASVLRTDADVFIGAGFADTQPQIRLTRNYSGGSPGIEMGPGGATAPDTFLRRQAAANLKTDGSFSAGQSVIVDTTDAVNKLYFGSALDTFLYRAAASDLRTDGRFRAGSTGTQMITIGAGASNASAAIYFSNLVDTVLYRQAAAALRVNGKFYTDDYLVAGFGSVTGQVIVGDTGTGINGLRFGNASDTVLYRSAAATLRTNSTLQVDGALVASGGLSSVGNFNVLGTAGDANPQIGLWPNYAGAGLPGVRFGPGGATALDTALYRLSPQKLRTDGDFGLFILAADTQPSLDFRRNYSAGGGILFGPGGTTAIDAALYRNSPGVLNVSGSLSVGLILSVQQGIRMDAGGTGTKLYFGTSDTVANFYRYAAGTIKSDGALITAGDVSVLAATADVQPQIKLVRDYGGVGQPGIFFAAGGASGGDAVIYRPAASILRVPHQFQVIGSLLQNFGSGTEAYSQVALWPNYGGTGMAGLVFSAGTTAHDVAMFRASAATLQINSHLNLYGSLRVDLGGTGAQKLYFGATDTVANLYRNAAGELRTDGTLRVGATAANILIDAAGTITGPANFDFRGTNDVYVTSPTAATAVTLRDLVGNYAQWRGGVLNLHSSGAAPRVQFQEDTVANLYRSAAGRVKTDGSFESVGGFVATPGAAANAIGLLYSPPSIVASQYVLLSAVIGEANHRFRIGPTGLMEWGTGAVAPDAWMYRSGVGVVAVNNALAAPGGLGVSPGTTLIYGLSYAPTTITAGQRVVSSAQVGDTAPRFYIDPNGLHWWGPGNGAVDASMYRFGAADLRIESTVRIGVGTSMVSLGGAAGGTPTLYFGNAFDTNLYRGSAGLLVTGGQFQAGSYAVVGSAANQMMLGYSGGAAAPGITFGNAQDTNLFRSAADTLRTDDSFVVGGNLTVTGSLFGAAPGALPTDAAVPAATRLITNKLLVGDTQPSWRVMGDGKHEWGPGGTTAPDTTLYRPSANVLKTDGRLMCNDGIWVDGGATRFIGTQGTGVNIFVNGYRYQFGADDTLTLMGASGKVAFGNPADAAIYRAGAGDLRTDGYFRAGSGASLVTVGGLAGGTPYIYFGNALDTNLYRAGADILRTDDSFQAAGSVRGTGPVFSDTYMVANNGLTNQILLQTNGYIYFSSAADVYIGRPSAGVLNMGPYPHISGVLVNDSYASYAWTVLSNYGNRDIDANWGSAQDVAMRLATLVADLKALRILS